MAEGLTSQKVGPNGYRLCKHGHERTPENVNGKRECRECCAIRDTKYKKDHAEELRLWHANYRANNAEKLRASWRKYNASHAEEKRNRAAVYREKNPDVSNIYRKNNLMKYRLHAHNRRSREKENGGRLSPDIAERLLVLQKGKCRICKKKINDALYHLDHIEPISKGGPNVDENIQVLCPRCNLRKMAKDPFVHAQELGMLFL